MYIYIYIYYCLHSMPFQSLDKHMTHAALSLLRVHVQNCALYNDDARTRFMRRNTLMKHLDETP